MKKKYLVTLTDEERQALRRLTAAGKASAVKLTRARILLKADQALGGRAWPGERIAQALDVGLSTIADVRQRFVERSLEAALERKEQDSASRQRKLDGRAEARLIALACSAPPEGRKEWTMRLLADRLVQLEVVDAVSDETVRRLLKKTNQAVAEEAVVHPAGLRRRVRLRHGGRARRLPPALRREAAAGVYRRGQQTVGRRDQAAAAAPTGPAGAVRLRVRPQLHRQPVHDFRTAVGRCR